MSSNNQFTNSLAALVDCDIDFFGKERVLLCKDQTLPQVLILSSAVLRIFRNDLPDVLKDAAGSPSSL